MTNTTSYQCRLYAKNDELIFFVVNKWEKNLIPKYFKFILLGFTKQVIYAKTIVGYKDCRIDQFTITFCNFEFNWRFIKEE